MLQNEFIFPYLKLHPIYPKWRHISTEAHLTTGGSLYLYRGSSAYLLPCSPMFALSAGGEEHVIKARWLPPKPPADRQTLHYKEQNQEITGKQLPQCDI